MSITITGVMFKTSIDDEKKFLQDYFLMKNIDGFSRTTWGEIQTDHMRSQDDKNNLIAVYQRNGSSIVYYDLLDYYSENTVENFCKDILEEHDGVSFICSEISMVFNFVFYTNGKRERMAVAYPENGSRRISGKNNLKMPRGGDEIESLIVLQYEYLGGFEPDDTVNLYWISNAQKERNIRNNKILQRENLIEQGKLVPRERLPKTNNNPNDLRSVVVFWAVAIAILALMVWLFGLIF